MEVQYFMWLMKQSTLKSEALIGNLKSQLTVRLINQNNLGFEVVQEFFVGQYFRGNEPFIILNEMLFEGSTGYALKLRSERNENNDNSAISGLP